MNRPIEIDEDAALIRAQDLVREDTSMVQWSLENEATDDEITAIHRYLRAWKFAEAGRIMSTVLRRAEIHEIRRRFERECEEAVAGEHAARSERLRENGRI